MVPHQWEYSWQVNMRRVKLESQKPNRVDVEIVRYRNNICHGNILEFVNRDLGEENSFFTPVSLRSLAFILIDISGAWAEQLGQFRRSGCINFLKPKMDGR
jgi:hypothetical protein